MATGPNTTVVSPDWEKKLLLKDKQTGTMRQIVERPQQRLEERRNSGTVPPPEKEHRLSGESRAIADEKDAQDVQHRVTVVDKQRARCLSTTVTDLSVRGRLCNTGTIATLGVNVAGNA